MSHLVSLRLAAAVTGDVEPWSGKWIACSWKGGAGAGAASAGLSPRVRSSTTPAHGAVVRRATGADSLALPTHAETRTVVSQVDAG